MCCADIGMENAHAGGQVLDKKEGVPSMLYPGCQGTSFGSLGSMSLVSMKYSGST